MNKYFKMVKPEIPLALDNGQFTNEYWLFERNSKLQKALDFFFKPVEIEVTKSVKQESRHFSDERFIHSYDSIYEAEKDSVSTRGETNNC